MSIGFIRSVSVSTGCQRPLSIRKCRLSGTEVVMSRYLRGNSVSIPESLTAHHQLEEKRSEQWDPEPALATNSLHRMQNTSAVQPILLQVGDEEPIPLVLLHDGSGSVAPYTRIKPVPFPLYGIANPSPTTKDLKITSLKQMAGLYADAIRSTFDGPVVIGGWSFGGVLAFEITQILKSQIAGTILIDSPPPINYQPLPDAAVTYILRGLRLDRGDPQDAVHYARSAAGRVQAGY
ncbi:Alpha/Beta hydrolase protein [Aspergillus varians]